MKSKNIVHTCQIKREIKPKPKLKQNLKKKQKTSKVWVAVAKFVVNFRRGPEKELIYSLLLIFLFCVCLRTNTSVCCSTPCSVCYCPQEGVKMQEWTGDDVTGTRVLERRKQKVTWSCCSTKDLYVRSAIYLHLYSIWCRLQQDWSAKLGERQ